MRPILYLGGSSRALPVRRVQMTTTTPRPRKQLPLRTRHGRSALSLTRRGCLERRRMRPRVVQQFRREPAPGAQRHDQRTAAIAPRRQGLGSRRTAHILLISSRTRWASLRTVTPIHRRGPT